MGDVIQMVDVRARRAEGMAGHGADVGFAFDLAMPETYLAAERTHRAVDRVAWVPVAAVAVHGSRQARDRSLIARCEAVEARARTLRMPLVWPDAFPFDGTAAMRVAELAAELGRGAEFVLAAGRLAFCGGFDLDDPEVLAEAAAAAGLPLEQCLAAAGNRTLDASLVARALALRARGATRLPVITVGARMFCGEERLPEAAAIAQARVQSPRTG